MGVTTFPSSILIDNHFSNSLPPTFVAKASQTNSNFLVRRLFFDSSLIQANSSPRFKGLSLTTFCVNNSALGDGDKRALETVLRLYDAIRERNTADMSDIIGEECRCVCNFVTAFQPCYGKKQVLVFFTSLMKSLGSKIQFEVEPSSQDGMNVGISWKLEWSKTGVPLGKGFSFYVCHVYQGKVMIRNVEMFMEPIFHFEPLRLKITGFVMNIMDKIGMHTTYKIQMKRSIYILLALPLIITLLFFTSFF